MELFFNLKKHTQDRRGGRGLGASPRSATGLSVRLPLNTGAMYGQHGRVYSASTPALLEYRIRYLCLHTS
jgi:hypothetical protein